MLKGYYIAQVLKPTLVSTEASYQEWNNLGVSMMTMAGSRCRLATNIMFITVFLVPLLMVN